LHNEHHEHSVLNLIYDAIISYTHTVKLISAL